MPFVSGSFMANILVKIWYPYALHSLSLSLPNPNPEWGKNPVTLAMKAGGWRLLVAKNIRTKEHPGFRLASFVKVEGSFWDRRSVTWAIIWNPKIVSCEPSSLPRYAKSQMWCTKTFAFNQFNMQSFNVRRMWRSHNRNWRTTSIRLININVSHACQTVLPSQIKTTYRLDKKKTDVNYTKIPCLNFYFYFSGPIVLRLS